MHNLQQHKATGWYITQRWTTHTCLSYRLIVIWFCLTSAILALASSNWLNYIRQRWDINAVRCQHELVRVLTSRWVSAISLTVSSLDCITQSGIHLTRNPLMVDLRTWDMSHSRIVLQNRVQLPPKRLELINCAPIDTRNKFASPLTYLLFCLDLYVRRI